MDFFNTDFKMSTASTSKRVASTNPEFSTTTSTGGLKINEATAKMVDIKNGEYMVLVSNFAVVDAAIKRKDDVILAWAEKNDAAPEDYPVSWGIAKGYAELDKDGNEQQTPERLSAAKRQEYIDLGKVDEEGNALPELVTKYKGAKMSGQSGAAGYAILTGNDSNNWAPLGGSDEELAIYEVSSDFVEMDLEEDGRTHKVYPLTNKTTKEKIQRG